MTYVSFFSSSNSDFLYGLSCGGNSDSQGGNGSDHGNDKALYNNLENLDVGRIFSGGFPGSGVNQNDQYGGSGQNMGMSGSGAGHRSGHGSMNVLSGITLSGQDFRDADY
ncbi:hypothetical protein G9A89_007602 [Geosiphon pyriformis]|nr:hypothetical protein G9A89_007602 [Geosiphon pyriformis]